MTQRRSILQPLGLALALAIGFATLMVIAFAWADTTWKSLNFRVSDSEVIEVREDGTPLIERQTNQTYGQWSSTYRTLDGAETKMPDDITTLDATWLSARSPGAGRNPNNSDELLLRFADAKDPPNYWYFVDNGEGNDRGYFVGYDSRSKHCIGFIGIDGIRPDRPPVERWFPFDGANGEFARYTGNRAYLYYNGSGYGSANFPVWKIDMISKNRLVEIDLRSGSVTTLMKSSDLVRVGMLRARVPSANKDTAAPKFTLVEKLAVRTMDRVLVFDRPDKQSAAYLIPEDIRGKSFNFYEIARGKALVVVPDKGLIYRSSYDELLWIDASGVVSRRMKVTLNQRSDAPDKAREAWEQSVAVPAPIVSVLMATVLLPLQFRDDGKSQSYSAALGKALAVYWPPLLAVMLPSAAMAWYCFRRHRRYHQRYAGVWFVFVLLLGLPGFVAYLFHRRWPVLEKCPACGKIVPRDREACACCGAPFPAPERTGCEVFA